MSLRRSVLGASLVVLALVAGGCGSGTGTDGSATPVVTKKLSISSVVERTEAASTAKAAFTVTMDAAGMPDAPEEPITMAAEGAVDLAAQRARFVMEIPEGLGDEELPFDGPLELVFDSTAVYVRLPAELAGDAGRPWARFSAEDGLPMFAGGMPGMDELFGPDMGLGVLEDLDGSGAEVLGRDTLRGDDVTHYRLSLDPTDAEEGAEDVAGMELFAGLGSLPVDLWVDDAGRFRKMTMEFDLAALMRAVLGAFAEGFGGEGAAGSMPDELDGSSMKMGVSFEAWDFGAPVEIQVPPADQVADGSSLPGLAGAFG